MKDRMLRRSPTLCDITVIDGAATASAEPYKLDVSHCSTQRGAGVRSRINCQSIACISHANAKQRVTGRDIVSSPSLASAD